MDSYTKIDWKHLKSIISDIELIINNYHDEDAKDKIELLNLFYQVEKELASVKEQLSLPYINSSISSASVIKSIIETPSNRNVILRDEITYDEYFRQNDYQYWLLIFLLLKNNSIREMNLTLYEIIDEFIDRVKNESFTWKDIEFTGSGATRCKTNIRFAYDDLKKVGLVNLYDKVHKKSWTLTFIGFFVAASYCFEPVDQNKTPFTKNITRFYQSTYYFRLNPFIWERIEKLSKPDYFLNLVYKLNLESLGLKELETGPEIFGTYFNYSFSLQKEFNTERKREKALYGFLNHLNEKYSLDNYMKELSLKFDAEAFFKELIEKTKNN